LFFVEFRFHSPVQVKLPGETVYLREGDRRSVGAANVSGRIFLALFAGQFDKNIQKSTRCIFYCYMLSYWRNEKVVEEKKGDVARVKAGDRFCLLTKEKKKGRKVKILE